jgi:hypothetical protein
MAADQFAFSARLFRMISFRSDNLTPRHKHEAGPRWQGIFTAACLNRFISSVAEELTQAAFAAEYVSRARGANIVIISDLTERLAL